MGEGHTTKTNHETWETHTHTRSNEKKTEQNRCDDNYKTKSKTQSFVFCFTVGLNELDVEWMKKQKKFPLNVKAHWMMNRMAIKKKQKINK